jgi:hypothetical protein
MCLVKASVLSEMLATIAALHETIVQLRAVARLSRHEHVSWRDRIAAARAYDALPEAERDVLEVEGP